MAGTPLLEVSDLRVQFGSVTAVSSVSLSIEAGEVVGIVGESGAGKSATAKAIISLLPTTATVTGSIKFRGEEMLGASKPRLRAMRGAEIGYIFQDALTALDPVRTIGAQLVEAAQVHQNISKQDAWKKAAALLDEVDIVDPERCLRSYPHQLSGGMRQRVVIAAALIADPQLIIADEVTSALDVTVQRKVIDLLLRVCADRGAAVLFITHDLGVVAQTCDRVMVLYGGIVAEEASVCELFDDANHPYTKALLDSLPKLGGNGEFVPIPGSAIQVVGELAHCPFVARCRSAADDCRKALPGKTAHGSRTIRCFHPVGSVA